MLKEQNQEYLVANRFNSRLGTFHRPEWCMGVFSHFLLNNPPPDFASTHEPTMPYAFSEPARPASVVSWIPIHLNWPSQFCNRQLFQVISVFLSVTHLKTENSQGSLKPNHTFPPFQIPLSSLTCSGRGQLMCLLSASPLVTYFQEGQNPQRFGWVAVPQSQLKREALTSALPANPFQARIHTMSNARTILILILFSSSSLS